MVQTFRGSRHDQTSCFSKYTIFPTFSETKAISKINSCSKLSPGPMNRTRELRLQVPLLPGRIMLCKHCAQFRPGLSHPGMKSSTVLQIDDPKIESDTYDGTQTVRSVASRKWIAKIARRENMKATHAQHQHTTSTHTCTVDPELQQPSQVCSKMTVHQQVPKQVSRVKLLGLGPDLAVTCASSLTCVFDILSSLWKGFEL